MSLSWVKLDGKRLVSEVVGIDDGVEGWEGGEDGEDGEDGEGEGEGEGRR